jgi:hypothetical protein
MAKKKKKKRGKKVNKHLGFSVQFLPYSQIKHLNGGERMKKILNIVLGNNILFLQGRLKPDEETRLIGDTMAMAGHLKGFKGVELAVISNHEQLNLLEKTKKRIVDVLAGGDLDALTIIGPATVIKEIKRDPKKIELLLNK